ncbi:hypothetical protein B0T19DRAFT_434844, partial [Cercophora scortea]
MPACLPAWFFFSPTSHHGTMVEAEQIATTHPPAQGASMPSFAGSHSRAVLSWMGQAKRQLSGANKQCSSGSRWRHCVLAGTGGFCGTWVGWFVVGLDGGRMGLAGWMGEGEGFQLRGLEVLFRVHHAHARVLLLGRLGTQRLRVYWCSFRLSCLG